MESKNGFSFCIITDGKDPQKTFQEIRSIRALGIPQHEILIGGECAAFEDADLGLMMPELARAGRLGAMRNALCAKACFDQIIVADDDLLFHGDFYDGFLKFGSQFDIASCKILNPDGTRYWDWKTYEKGVNTLLGYEQISPLVSLSGTFCMMKREVFKLVQWDPIRTFYQEEDVDFSIRLKIQGIKIVFNPYSTITHNDERYTQSGRHILIRNREELMLRKWFGCFLERGYSAQ